MIADIKKNLEGDLEKISPLDGRIKEMTNLMSIIASGALSLFKKEIKEQNNLTILEIEEVVIQAVPYLGYSKAFEFFAILDTSSYVPIKDSEERLKEGIDLQVEIFGENMKDFYKSGDEYSRNINYLLAKNCFGDYYSRGYLSVKERELLTFVALLNLGTIPQLKAHIKGNFNVGNDKALLLKVILNNVFYVGYPRSLNAINALKEVVGE